MGCAAALLLNNKRRACGPYRSLRQRLQVAYYITGVLNGSQ